VITGASFLFFLQATNAVIAAAIIAAGIISFFIFKLFRQKNDI
jgi:hypothetical protein